MSSRTLLRRAPSSTPSDACLSPPERPFRVIKRQFGLMKVRFRGLVKNTAHAVTLFALSNLWMARRQLMAMAVVRPRSA